MKFILLACVFIASTIKAQTKEETKDWIKFYVNKYSTTITTDGWNTNKLTYEAKYFDFDKDTLTIYTVITRRIQTPFKDSTISKKIYYLDLSALKKIEIHKSTIGDEERWQYQFYFNDMPYPQYPVRTYDFI
jgi:hypothetical protein